MLSSPIFGHINSPGTLSIVILARKFTYRADLGFLEGGRCWQRYTHYNNIGEKVHLTSYVVYSYLACQGLGACPTEKFWKFGSNFK